MAYAANLPVPAEKPARWGLRRDEMLFFASCYAAGVAFFLIMLS